MHELPTGTVTFLFTDIEGSTRLLHELGDGYVHVLAEHRRVLRESFARHGGVEVDTQGDAFFVAFARASDALAAAGEAQSVLDGPVRVRIGVHTGEPLVTDEGYVGIDVHRAARIAAVGHGGQVLVSQSTRDLAGANGLRDLGEHRLKDLTAPERIWQLGDDDFPPLKTLYRTNLPVQPTQLVGRERELRDVVELVRSLRLVTLTGAGGSGKTRLALQTAAELSEEFRDGVWFVSLAPLTDPSLLPQTIASAIGAGDELADYLAEKTTLLLLDNLEQLLPMVAGAVAELLVASGVHVLATSRERLAVEDEVEYPVLGLQVDEAASLFAMRAGVLAASPEKDEDVLEIVRRVDGLPLAIELAAARTKVLTPRQIAERLGRSLSLLTGGRRDAPARQRTLRATIEWSYELLSDDERRLFTGLGVFAGSFDLEAAEAVCDADLDTLQSLVEKSLVRHTAAGRFFMLETIREFAREELFEDASSDETERAHALFFLALTERADADCRTEDATSAFASVDADYANVRSAIAWCRAVGAKELEGRFVAALWPYWLARGHIAEGKRHLDEALAQGAEPMPRIRLGQCVLRHLAGDEARNLLADATAVLEAFEELHDGYSLAQTWNLIGRLEASSLGNVTQGEEAWARALEHAERGGYRAERAESMGWLMVMSIFGSLPTDQGIARCRAFFDESGDEPKVRAFAQVERAVLEAMRGDFDIARELLAAGTRAFQALGLNVWAANNAQEAFYVEMLAGAPDRAETVLRESYEALREMGERGFMSTIAAFLALALAAQGKYDEADRFSRLSEEAAASDDMFSQVIWRTARAKVCAARGELDGAEALARRAVDLAELQPDQLNMQADTLVDLAEISALRGSHGDASRLLEAAAALYERKGNLVALGKTRDRLTTILA